MKKVKVYGWDQSCFWNYYNEVDQTTYQLQDNQTYDPIPQGMDEPVVRVNGQSGSWRQPTAEEKAAYQKTHPVQKPNEPSAPSQEQQMINMLGKTQMTQGTQIDANKADINQMKQMINLLGKQQMAQGNK